MALLFITQYQGKIVGPVAWLLGHLMNGIFNVLSAIGLPNIGLSIIIFTIVIYLCLLPLTYKQQKFSKLQAKMSPELKVIQDKYKGKKDNDSMLAMQQETKEVYAKYGVSQTGSCLQLLIQMPILFALYRVIYAMPAYVTQVGNTFRVLADKIVAQDGGDYIINASRDTLKSVATAVSQYSKNLEGDNLINGIIDVLNKTSSIDMIQLSNQYGLSDLQYNGQNILSTYKENGAILHKGLIDTYNYFLGLNIGDTPLYTIQTAFANKQFLLLIGGLLVPFLAALTQWINTKLMPQSNTNNGKIDPDDPTAQMQQSMKTMNVMMPLMSAFFCLSLPAGMGIYWIAGAVVRSIQQIVINRHIDKIDIDAEIEKNTAKYKEKLEKNKTTRSMNLYANLSTKNNDLSSTSSKTKISESEKEANMKKASDIYGSGKVRKDSLLAKANMVKEFNEKNNK